MHYSTYDPPPQAALVVGVGGGHGVVGSGMSAMVPLVMLRVVVFRRSVGNAVPTQLHHSASYQQAGVVVCPSAPATPTHPPLYWRRGCLGGSGVGGGMPIMALP